MTFTGRIRAYLIAVALLPPLMVMMVIYFQSESQLENAGRREAFAALQKYEPFADRFSRDLINHAKRLEQIPAIDKAFLEVSAGRDERIDISHRPAGIDFIELLDTNLIVRASSHRPGLVGRTIHEDETTAPLDDSTLTPTVEYDIDGPHAAFACLVPTGSGLSIYAGRYIDAAFEETVAGLIGANLELTFQSDTASFIGRLQPTQLYERDGQLIALVAGGERAGFFLIATFLIGSERPLFRSLLKATGLVALGSVIIAVLLGLYITNRAKREIDNLIEATSRVAAGDFGTPVMAYEEGEFSQLSDSFSEMMVRLKQSQQKLAVAEKIAAWQAIGRKVAHEVRNPLTPISISIEDLKHAHDSDHPDFRNLLSRTVNTVRTEIHRMSALLEQFVGFARMSAPVIRDAHTASMVNDLIALYGKEIDSQRLRITDRTGGKTFRFDPEAIKQVGINLIKNGLEADAESKVTVLFKEIDTCLTITFEDNGPGFSQARLNSSFEPYVSTKKEGTGLGLVICQRIVHDHGGNIELSNRAEGGARITLNLPSDDGQNTDS